MDGHSHNPFQTPQAELHGPDTAQPLYSLAGIGLATFLGTPLAGAWLLVHNLRLLGKHERVVQAWACAVGLFVVTLVLAFLLPEEVPALPFAIAQLFAMMVFARHLIEVEIKQHAGGGGAFLSNWRAAGIGLLVTIVLALLLFGLLLIFEL